MNISKSLVFCLPANYKHFGSAIPGEPQEDLIHHTTLKSTISLIFPEDKLGSSHNLTRDSVGICA